MQNATELLRICGGGARAVVPEHRRRDLCSGATLRMLANSFPDKWRVTRYAEKACGLCESAKCHTSSLLLPTDDLAAARLHAAMTTPQRASEILMVLLEHEEGSPAAAELLSRSERDVLCVLVSIAECDPTKFAMCRVGKVNMKRMNKGRQSARARAMVRGAAILKQRVSDLLMHAGTEHGMHLCRVEQGRRGTRLARDGERVGDVMFMEVIPPSGKPTRHVTSEPEPLFAEPTPPRPKLTWKAQPPVTPPPPSPPSLPSPPAKSGNAVRNVLIGVVVVAVLVLLSVAAYMYIGSDNDDTTSEMRGTPVFIMARPRPRSATQRATRGL